jgi:hypothetical protein
MVIGGTVVVVVGGTVHVVVLDVLVDVEGRVVSVASSGLQATTTRIRVSKRAKGRDDMGTNGGG